MNKLDDSITEYSAAEIKTGLRIKAGEGGWRFLAGKRFDSETDEVVLSTYGSSGKMTEHHLPPDEIIESRIAYVNQVR